MNIVVCVKFTPDIKDLEIRADGSVSLERAEWTIGEFDLNAVEAGVKLCEEVGGKVIGLSAGPREIDNSKLKKDILSRGLDELVIIVDDALKDADTTLTSTVLAAAIRKLGQVDIVICGEGSADLYFQQVGIQVGERLDWPTTNSVRKIQLVHENIYIERDLEEVVELLEVPLPAVLSVTTDINIPRLPTMKEILKANRKPINVWSLADTGIDFLPKQIPTVSMRAPEKPERSRKIISGTANDAVKELIACLDNEGVL